MRAALPDAEKVLARDPQGAAFYRYLCAYHLADFPEALLQLFSVLSLHVNMLSRNGRIVAPRVILPWLWRIDLRDYRIDPTTYSAAVFGKAPFGIEPWFHVLGKGVINGPDGKPLSQNGDKNTPLLAPWLPKKETGRLGEILHSIVPILRADWFIHRTAAQSGRDGFGYFDFLGLKSRDDFDKLVDLDRKKAAENFRERLAFVIQSKIAASGKRQVFRYLARTGPVWETHDISVDTFGQAQNNVENNLFEDFKHNAEEIVGVLPNDLPVYFLCNQDGVRQDTAPDKAVQGDHTAGGTDHRIHASKSCASCHEGAGLKPFAAKAPKAPIEIAVSADKQGLHDRTNSALRPYLPLLKQDMESFAAAYWEACQMKPADAAKSYGGVYDFYDGTGDLEITRDQAARDFGLTPKEFAATLKEKLARKPDGQFTPYPPALDNFLEEPPGTISRGQEEELVPYLMPMFGFPGVEDKA